MRKAHSKKKTPAPVAQIRPATSLDSEANLAEKAYQAILQGLFDRTIPAGSEYSQAELMRLLGLTASPLRDALRILENEGLVTIYARSCIRFLRADLELSRSTYQFRSFIERPGARALAEKGDAAEIRSLIDEHVALL